MTTYVVQGDFGRGWEDVDQSDDRGEALEDLRAHRENDPSRQYRMTEREEKAVQTYKIVRKFFDDNVPEEVLTRGLTLEQAQAHCDDPETSSQTATGAAGVARTEQCGPWFDMFYKE